MLDCQKLLLGIDASSLLVDPYPFGCGSFLNDVQEHLRTVGRFLNAP
jgi:hypothetical protein